MQKTRTPEQILADLDKQFPKTNSAEEGKQTMARKTPATAPEKVQEDPSRVRRLLQKHQNKKLTVDDFGRLLLEAFGKPVRYELSKAITSITDVHHKDVQANHITYDFRGGWGKAVNIRAFIPQTHDGRGVQIRISMDVVNGVWDAKTAKQYEDPHPFEGTAIEQPIAGSGKPREDAKLPADDSNSTKIQQSGISGMRLPNGLADIGAVNEFETERAGVVYRNVTVRTGWLATGDTGVILNADGVTICPAEIKNIIDSKGVVTNLGTGNTAAIEFEYVIDEMPLHAGCTFVVQERASQDPEAKKPFSLADLGRRPVRSLHSRNPTPPTTDGHAVVLGAHPHPSGTQYGVRVTEGNLRVADVLQVWRDGRYHTGAHLVGINREGGEAIQILLMGEQAGLFLNLQGITDLKAGDEIYVVDRAEMAKGTAFSNMTLDKDARSEFATIPLTGMSQKHVTELSRSALVALCVPVTEIANANSAVMQLLEAVRSSNMVSMAHSLVIEWFHDDEFYPRAVRATVQFGVERDEAAIGVVFIADGQARRSVIYSVGKMVFTAPALNTKLHGLVAYCSLNSFLNGLDERDRADFEHSWLEEQKLGLAEEVVFRQSENQVMEVWVEKHKTMLSGHKVATLEFGKNGIERFKFFGVEPRTTLNELGVKVQVGASGFNIVGPLRAEFAGPLSKLITTEYGFLGACLVDSFKEVQRVATEALVDNPDHWADDEIVPWEAEFRGLRDGQGVYQVAVIIRNMKEGHPASGFCLKINSVSGSIRTSLVYGFGRYADLKLVKGVEMWANEGLHLIADHLIDAKTDYRDMQFITAFGEGLTHGDKIIVLDVPERNAAVIALTERDGQKIPHNSHAVLGELSLVNGRIVSWAVAGKRRPIKAQAQPHRHHQMDAEHEATSIVPRPRVTGHFQNLHQVQLMVIIRQLLLDDTQKLGMLQDFVENVVANARDGGTENALLFTLDATAIEVMVYAQYLDTAGQSQGIAKMSVII